jgi:hypothetical protein
MARGAWDVHSALLAAWTGAAYHPLRGGKPRSNVIPYDPAILEEIHNSGKFKV